MTFDRIITSAPINKQAATVTGEGETWVPTVKLQDYFEDMPRLVDPKTSYQPHPSFVDFRGMTFGRLTVIGKLFKANKDAPSSWVCRCKCGGYCTRLTKSLNLAMNNGNSFVDRCGRCEYVASLRKGWSPQPKADAPKLKRG